MYIVIVISSFINKKYISPEGIKPRVPAFTSRCLDHSDIETIYSIHNTITPKLGHIPGLTWDKSHVRPGTQTSNCRENKAGTIRSYSWKKSVL